MLKQKSLLILTLLLICTSVLGSIEGNIIAYVSLLISVTMALILFSLLKNEKQIVNDSTIDSDLAVSVSDTVSENSIIEFRVKDITNLPVEQFGRNIFLELSSQFELSIGFFYEISQNKNKIISHFAIPEEFELSFESSENDGIIEQVVADKKMLVISDIPNDFPNAFSGLGQSTPTDILFVPIIKNNECVYLFELGFLKQHSIEIYNTITETIVNLNYPIHE